MAQGNRSILNGFGIAPIAPILTYLSIIASSQVDEMNTTGISHKSS
jgi:hypothetical protein